MNQPESLTEFVRLLIESGLLTDDEFSQAQSELALDECDSSLEIARRLVKAKVITRYQAERLLAGRTRGFFYDHYEILELLGFGGMGSLYLAEDSDTGEAVALKVLNEQYREDAGMLTRLKLEAEAGKRLHHDNIVQTREVRDTGAVCYVVMEFIKGVNLLELMRTNGPLPSEQACDFIRQAAEGLKYAHEHGMVHRDVKPDNLITDPQGKIKVLDFGLAMIADRSESEFSLAMIFGHDRVGTTDYISPEQVVDCQAVDERTDIYSLGCTLYQLLSGEVPFPAKTSKEKIQLRFKTKPKRLREHVPGIDKKLEWVVFKMMAAHKDIRFQNMQEVIDALAPFAKRTPAAFRFGEVLSQRLRDARLRSEMAHPSRNHPRLSSRVATASAIADAAQQRADMLDTNIESDTRPSVTGVYRQWIPDESTDQLAQRVAGDVIANAKPALLVSKDGSRRIAVKTATSTIGRGADCEIRIDEPGISNVHAELHREGDWWAIRDKNSKNGIAVNGVPVREQMLWPGDTITFAQKYEFRLIDPDQEQKKQSRKIWQKTMVTVLLVLTGLILAGVWALFLR